MAKKVKLKIIPLGGLNEIGKNITAFECGGDILVLDCGMAFPDDSMLGVDCVIPDMSYLILEQELKPYHQLQFYFQYYQNIP